MQLVPAGKMIARAKTDFRNFSDSSSKFGIFHVRKLNKIRACSSARFRNICSTRLRRNCWRGEFKPGDKIKVSEWMVRAWEHDQLLPTKAQWQVLAVILHLDC
jgi:hypothetical protein